MTEADTEAMVATVVRAVDAGEPVGEAIEDMLSDWSAILSVVGATPTSRLEPLWTELKAVAYDELERRVLAGLQKFSPRQIWAVWKFDAEEPMTYAEVEEVFAAAGCYDEGPTEAGAWEIVRKLDEKGGRKG